MFLCPSVYEAGKMAKTAKSAQLPVYPYYIPGVPSVVPSMMPLAPSSHLEPKLARLPSVENNLAAGEYYNSSCGPCVTLNLWSMFYFTNFHLITI